MNTRIRTIVSLVLLTAGTQASTVYFGTFGDGIYTGKLDPESGTLSDIERACEIDKPGFIAFHPTRPVLYAVSSAGKAESGCDSVSAMNVNPDGSLTLLNRQSTGGLDACHVSTDPAGKVVLAVNYKSGSVVSYQILNDGSLSEPRSQHQHEGSGRNAKRQEGPHAHSVFTDPAGAYAYVADLGIDKIMIYHIEPSSGALIESGYAEVPGGGMGPRHMKWSADGKYAYVLNELDLSLSVFRATGKQGALEWVTTKSVLPKGAEREKLSCAEIRIHPNEKFIYLSTRDLAGKGRDSISVFSAYDSGFDRIATIPAQVWFPRNFNLDPSGKWLLIGGQRSDNLAVFNVDPATGLIEFADKVALKHGPVCIEFLHD